MREAARQSDWGCWSSVDGQDLLAAGAAAGTAEVAAIASGGLHCNVKTSRSRDHGGCNGGSELRTADHDGGHTGAIENHNGGGNEMAAGRSDDETGRQL